MRDGLVKTWTIWDSLEYVRLWKEGDMFIVDHVFGDEEPEIFDTYDSYEDAVWKAEGLYEDYVRWYVENAYDGEVSV